MTFLDAYKSLENELRDDGLTVLDFENTMKEGTNKERLKVCRIMRNYMSHNDTNFLTASDKQVSFLEDLIDQIRSKAYCVKDAMKKPKLEKPTITIKNLVILVDKYGIVPIEVKGKGIFLVDKDILIHQMAVGNKKIVIPARLPKYPTLDKMIRMDKVDKGTYIVLEKEKYVGVLRKE